MKNQPLYSGVIDLAPICALFLQSCRLDNRITWDNGWTDRCLFRQGHVASLADDTHLVLQIRRNNLRTDEPRPVKVELEKDALVICLTGRINVDTGADEVVSLFASQSHFFPAGTITCTSLGSERALIMCIFMPKPDADEVSTAS